MLRATPLQTGGNKSFGHISGEEVCASVAGRARPPRAGRRASPLASRRARWPPRVVLARHTTAERMDALLGYDSDDSPVSRAASRDAPPDPKRPRLVDDPPDDATSSGRVRALSPRRRQLRHARVHPRGHPSPPPRGAPRDASRPSSRSPRPSAPSAATPPDPTLDPDALVPDHLHVSLSRVFPIRIDARASSSPRSDARSRPWTPSTPTSARPSASSSTTRETPRSSRWTSPPPRDSAETEGDGDDRYDDRHDRFRAMVRAVDEALDARGYPTFYRRPVPHVSLLWCRARTRRRRRKPSPQSPRSRTRVASRPGEGREVDRARGSRRV